MKNKFLSIFFLSVFTISPAQQNEQKSMATFGIMSSLLNRRWTFGYIHKISERIRIGADLGYGAQGFLVPRIDKKENFKSFEIRPAFYYSLSPKSVLKHFVGADFFIIKTDKTLQNQHFYDDYQYYWADKADMKRRKIGANLTYSILLHKETSRIAFIPKVGFGVRNLDIKYNNIQNLSLSDTPIDGFPFFSETPREGTKFNFDLDIKFVYKF